MEIDLISGIGAAIGAYATGGGAKSVGNVMMNIGTRIQRMHNK